MAPLARSVRGRGVSDKLRVEVPAAELHYRELLLQRAHFTKRPLADVRQEIRGAAGPTADRWRPASWLRPRTQPPVPAVADFGCSRQSVPLSAGRSGAR